MHGPLHLPGLGILINVGGKKAICTRQWAHIFNPSTLEGRRTTLNSRSASYIGRVPCQAALHGNVTQSLKKKEKEGRRGSKSLSRPAFLTNKSVCVPDASQTLWRSPGKGKSQQEIPLQEQRPRLLLICSGTGLLSLGRPSYSSFSTSCGSQHRQEETD